MNIVIVILLLEEISHILVDQFRFILLYPVAAIRNVPAVEKSHSNSLELVQ